MQIQPHLTFGPKLLEFRVGLVSHYNSKMFNSPFYYCNNHPTPRPSDLSPKRVPVKLQPRPPWGKGTGRRFHARCFVYDAVAIPVQLSPWQRCFAGTNFEEAAGLLPCHHLCRKELCDDRGGYLIFLRLSRVELYQPHPEIRFRQALYAQPTGQSRWLRETQTKDCNMLRIRDCKPIG